MKTVFFRILDLKKRLKWLIGIALLCALLAAAFAVAVAVAPALWAAPAPPAEAPHTSYLPTLQWVKSFESKNGADYAHIGLSDRSQLLRVGKKLYLVMPDGYEESDTVASYGQNNQILGFREHTEKVYDIFSLQYNMVYTKGLINLSSGHPLLA